MRVLTVVLDVPQPAETGLHLRQLAILRLVRELGCESHSLIFRTAERPILSEDLDGLSDRVHDGGRRVEYGSLSAWGRVVLRLSMILPALVGRRSSVYPYSIPYDLAHAERVVLQTAEDVEAEAVVLPTVLLHLAPRLSKRGYLVIGDAPDIVSQLTRRVLTTASSAPWRLPGLLVNHVVTRRQESLFLPECTEIWVSTAYEADEMRKLAPKARVFVAGNTLDGAWVIASPLPLDGPVGFIGNFALSVNFDAARFLIEKVWPVVLEGRPRARLALAGAGIPADKVRNFQQIPGVEVRGRVEDAPAFVRSCRAMALPVRIRAGLPMKLVEALACGRPVVATPELVAGLSLRVGDEVLVADAADDFAASILRLLGDDDLATHLSTYGRRRFDREFSFAASLEPLRAGSILAVHP